MKINNPKYLACSRSRRYDEKTVVFHVKWFILVKCIMSNGLFLSTASCVMVFVIVNRDQAGMACMLVNR